MGELEEKGAGEEERPHLATASPGPWAQRRQAALRMKRGE